MRSINLIVIALIGVCISSCGTDSNPTLYDVQVSVSPAQGGSVSPTADSTYEEGQQATIKAEPAEGYAFRGWSGDIDTTANPLSITVDQNLSLMANFEKRSYELTINTEGEGTVNEQVLETKSKEYEHGTIVELTANPAEGWTFVEWQGDIGGSENPAQITVDQAKEVTAVFEKKSYELTINTEGEGAVNKDPDQSEYAYNTTVTLEAVPASGWSFTEWIGDISSTDSTINITIDQARQITAVFEESEDENEDDRLYTLDVQIEGAGSYETKLLTGTKQDSGYTFESKVRIFFDIEEGHYLDRLEGDLDINYDVPRFGIFKKNVVLEDDMTVIGVIKEIPFAGGSGTVEDPYQVATLGQLEAIRIFISVSKYYNQVSNIDASATGNWNDGKGFRPISGKKVTYNGQENTISNLTIKYNSPEYIGLFDLKNSDSEFRNLTLENVYVNSTGRTGRDDARYTGSIAGKGKAYNINVTGTIKGEGSVGGIVGSGTVENSQADVEVTGERKNAGALVGQGDVINSTATGKVLGSENVGGLTGLGTVKNSHASVDVSGELDVGGLVGVGSSSNSYATGNITGKKNTGGLIGYLTNKISQSYATGTVSGTNNVGGLVGVSTDGYRTDADTIIASYALGNVSGTDNVGGLMGKVDDISIKNSYSHGDIDGQENVGGFIGSLNEYKEVLYSFSTGKVSGSTNVGGFLGSATDLRDSRFNGNYWDINTSNQSEGVGNKNDVGVDGLTTNQLTGDNAEENMAEFNFMEIWITTDEYPILRWQE